MLGRREFAIAGLSSVAVAALRGSAVAAQKPRGDGPHGEHHEMFESCAKACNACQRACDSCATHCAHRLGDGHKEHFNTLLLCRDCATVCSSAAEIVARGGPFSHLICEACAKACDECAKGCEKFPDDKHMKECAEECRKCEKACKEMVKHGHH